jgi:hypothetical protein
MLRVGRLQDTGTHCNSIDGGQHAVGVLVLPVHVALRSLVFDSLTADNGREEWKERPHDQSSYRRETNKKISHQPNLQAAYERSTEQKIKIKTLFQMNSPPWPGIAVAGLVDIMAQSSYLIDITKSLTH